ncbi:MAG: RDD family protein, partial [Bacilli bacterium]|nr:RDD family protein [Bacilli bacterium]
ILSYILASIITFVVIPMIKFTGITIGKRVSKLEVADRHNGPLQWYQILIRGMVQLVEYSLFLPFAGFLSFGTDVLTMPLFNIGGNVTTMSAIVIVGAFLTVASIILSLVTSENQSLHGLASSTVVNSSDLVKINAERMRLENLKNEEK